MKILLISPFFPPDVGGVETMLSKFCDYLSKKEYDTVIMTYNPLFVKTKVPFKDKINKHVIAWRTPWPGRGLFNIFEKCPPIQFLYLVPALTFSSLLYLLFSRKKPDVIHAFGLSAAFTGGLMSRIFKIPCVVDMCTVYRFPERPKLAWFVQHFLNMSDYIRGNNLSGKDELEKIGIDPKKLGMITPPVDETVFKPISQEEARKKIDLPLDKFVTLFVGRMVESKNVEIAVSATKLIDSPDVRFVFVGEGPLRNLVDGAAKKDKRIIVFNSVKHHDLVDYYNSGDILMCAPVDKNLIAFVGREALMCGLPILALNVATYAGVPYEVEQSLVPEKIGKLVDAKPEAVANYINKLIDLREKKEKLPFRRSDCSQYAIYNFSQQAMDWLGNAYEKAKQIHFSK